MIEVILVSVLLRSSPFQCILIQKMECLEAPWPAGIDKSVCLTPCACFEDGSQAPEILGEVRQRPLSRSGSIQFFSTQCRCVLLCLSNVQFLFLKVMAKQILMFFKRAYRFCKETSILYIIVQFCKKLFRQLVELMVFSRIK